MSCRVVDRMVGGEEGLLKGREAICIVLSLVNVFAGIEN